MTAAEGPTSGVALVIVSHSRKLAEGVVELAAQMAPNVRMAAAGGTAGGGVGTNYEAVSAALSDVDTGSGVVVLYDLGSAQMTAELAVEALEDPAARTPGARVVVADAPLVEGAVAAAVAAQAGKDAEAVARAAESAGAPEPPQATASPATEVSEELVLRNEVGLHARPAALVARSLTGLQAKVTITLGGKEADAASVLGIMGLGARKGDRITLHATGPDAQDAVQRLLDLAARNFDE